MVHFTTQRGFFTDVPSIYHPHDLQHEHLPTLFDPRDLAFRRRWYRELCEQAAIVAVASSWTKQDVVSHLGLAASKVAVVPLAPPLAALQTPTELEQRRARSAFRLPERYVIYPAQTWPHKNHLQLLRALADLRDVHGLEIPLVLTGRRNRHASSIDAAIAELRLSEVVTWLGFLEPADLAAVFANAVAVVVPSLFEAASAPMWEGFLYGVPVACSNVTALPSQAGDAALIFDPADIGSIADAVRRLWTDPDLREALIARGRSRVRPFTWTRAARHFRALYRQIARVPLTEEDRAVLAGVPEI